MKRFILLSLLLTATFSCAAAQPPQRPLYIVNGERQDDIASIPPEEIERIEELPADEETIARYGYEASNGVILVTLRYDEPARFEADSLTFDAYVAHRVRWNDDAPAARVVLRYTVTEDGTAIVTEELESTDGRLKRRILKAVAEAPKWQPAKKNGRPVASEGVLRIQLPEGKTLPRQVELIWR